MTLFRHGLTAGKSLFIHNRIQNTFIKIFVDKISNITVTNEFLRYFVRCFGKTCRKNLHWLVPKEKKTLICDVISVFIGIRHNNGPSNKT